MSGLFDLNSIAINYQSGEAGKATFVFLHGNTQNSSCGKGMLDFFQKRGHSVLSWDLPGHGDTPLTINHYTFDDLVVLNHQILQRYQLINPILCGHSIGGMIHAATIKRFSPTISSLVMCGSYDANPIEKVRELELHDALYMQTSLEEYITSAEGLFKQQKKYDYFSNNQLDDAFVEIINRRYTSPEANKINLTTLTGFTAREALKELNRPILVMHGEQETVIPKVLVESMLAENTNMQVEWFPKRGHNAFYQEPELTDKLLAKHYRWLTES